MDNRCLYLVYQFGQLTDDAAEIEVMIRTYRTYNAEHHDALVQPYPGALEAVRSLREAGGRLGVVTSKANASARQGLALCGFDGLFEVLVGSDDVDRHKPDPHPVRAALELLGTAPNEAVYVGDSPHDVTAGRAAGTWTAAALWGPFTRGQLEATAPDVWLNDAAEIASLPGLTPGGGA